VIEGAGVTEPGPGAPANPLPYPEDRADIVRTLRQPWGHLWLRIVARLMEWLSDLQPKKLNYSEVTPQLAVGGAFRTGQIKHLQARGVTAVVDCREEAKDDPRALGGAGIELLHLPAPDRYSLSFDQLSEGARWVNERLAGGGRVFMHCEHGVGRGPLMACAVLVVQGHSAPEALRIVRAGRWQAMPNDRQLAGLLAFEDEWRRRTRAIPRAATESAES
jgi:hypothetical protein